MLFDASIAVAGELADLAQLDDLVAVASAAGAGASLRRAAGGAAGGGRGALAVAAAGAAGSGRCARSASAWRGCGAAALPLAMASMWSSTSSRVIRPTGPRAGDRRRVEAVLVDEAAHDRRQQTPGGAGWVPRRRMGVAAQPVEQRRRGAGAGAAGAGSGAGCFGSRRVGSGRVPAAGARRCGASSAGSAARPAVLRRRGSGSAAGASAARLGGARQRRRRASPPSLTTAITVPTATVSPSGTRISVTVPDDRRRHLRVDLVGRHLEQRLVGVDVVADRLEPLRDRALGDRLAELRERDFSQCRNPFSSPFSR